MKLIEIILAIIVCVGLVCGLGFILERHIDYNYLKSLEQAATKSMDASKANGSLEVGKSYVVSRVVVKEGHIFDVSLENGKRYLVQLVDSYGSPDEAKEQVLRLLNDAKRDGGQPLVVVPRFWNENGHRWIVDIYFDAAKQTSLTSWLSARSLLYSK